MTAPLHPAAKAEGAQPLADLDRLAKAVAVAETSGCTDGTALKRNNCHGIMCWDKEGVRYPCYFPSHAASFTTFKKTWTKPTLPYQGKFPDIALASTYTGADHTDTWLCNVYRSYYGVTIKTDDDCHAILKRKHPDQYAKFFGTI